MITFSRLGNYGNLGNQLHELASLIGFSERYGCQLIVPQWKYSKYFKFGLAEGTIEADMLVEEIDFHYTPEYWRQYETDFRTKVVDVKGYLQSEKYWSHCIDKVLTTFKFETDFSEKVKIRFKNLFNKPTIAISVRRGDFATLPGYYLLPMEYYIGALNFFFPNSNDYNIIFFSDDLRFCKSCIRPRKNVFFASRLNDIEQLCLMSLCNHFIISNSTFSWWGARLGENQDSLIIRSPYQYTGWLSKMDTSDYYPRRWKTFDHVSSTCETVNFLRTGFEFQFWNTVYNPTLFLRRMQKGLRNMKNWRPLFHW